MVCYESCSLDLAHTGSRECITQHKLAWRTVGRQHCFYRVTKYVQCWGVGTVLWHNKGNNTMSPGWVGATANGDLLYAGNGSECLLHWDWPYFFATGDNDIGDPSRYPHHPVLSNSAGISRCVPAIGCGEWKPPRVTR